MTSLLVRASGLYKVIPQVTSTTGYIIVVSSCFLPALVYLLIHLSNLSNQRVEPRGCRKLGLRIRSNVADEHDPRYLKGLSQPPGRGKEIARVKSLWIYPIKSTKGVELNRGDVVPTGFQYDRQFSFAELKSKFPGSSSTKPAPKEEVHTWTYITQRAVPKLARVKAEVWVPDTSSPTYSRKEPNVQSGGVLVIRYPWIRDGVLGYIDRLTTRIGREPHHSIQIPFNPTAEQIKANSYTMEQMKIWKDDPLSLCIATTGSPESQVFINELRYFLGVANPLALFRIPADDPRKVFRNAPKKEELGYQAVVGFADSYPLHLLNLASVHDVGSKIPQDAEAPKLTILQFRGNIIMTGPEAFNEDSWKWIKIGDYEYFVTSRTSRCKLPNTNQVTGIPHKSEPDTTLRSYRKIDPGVNAACLGMMLVPAEEHSVIKVGDPIELLETGEHFYLKG